MRSFYLADGTLQTSTSGRVHDDEIHTRIVTERVVVRDDGQMSHANAPVHMDPDNPKGPLVVHFDGDEDQRGLTVIDDSKQQDPEVLTIDKLGQVNAYVGVITDTIDASRVAGDAFDKGPWVPESSSLPVPSHDTAVTSAIITVSAPRHQTPAKP